MLNKLKMFLPIAEKVIDKRTVIPILEHICISNGLMRATDLENTVIMPIEDKREYSISVKLLKNVLASKPKELKIDLSGFPKVKIIFDKKTLSYNSLLTEEFPIMLDEKFVEIGTWTKDVLVKIYKQLSFASNDDLRQTLTGVFIEQNSKLLSCTTDGHALNLIKNLDPEDKCKLVKNFTGIIPRKPLQILAKAAIGNTKVFTGDNYIRFDLQSGIQLIIKLVEGKFPNYKSVINENMKKEVHFKTDEMLKVILASKPFMSQATQRGILSINNGTIGFSVINIEQDMEFETTIPAIKNNGAMEKIAFNLHLLERTLKAVEGDTTVWNLESPVGQSLFSVVDDKNKINLLMPVKLKEGEV